MVATRVHGDSTSCTPQGRHPGHAPCPGGVPGASTTPPSPGTCFLHLLWQSSPLSRGHCPLPLQSLISPPQEGTVQGSCIWQIPCPVDGSTAPEMATCPSPYLNLRCLSQPFTEEKKKRQALSNLAKVRCLNSMATSEGHSSKSVTPICGACSPWHPLSLPSSQKSKDSPCRHPAVDLQQCL